MGQIAGYIVADYLIQHANRERRTARMPASTCDALRSHTGDPADAARLGDSAEGTLLYCYAIPLYRHTADAGDVSAAFELAGLLAEHGNLDEAMQILPRRGRRAQERPAASQAADATGPPRRSGATAPVRPEPGRVNCQRVKASCLSPHDARTARRIPEAA